MIKRRKEEIIFISLVYYICGFVVVFGKIQKLQSGIIIKILKMALLCSDGYIVSVVTAKTTIIDFHRSLPCTFLPS